MALLWAVGLGAWILGINFGLVLAAFLHRQRVDNQPIPFSRLREM